MWVADAAGMLRCCGSGVGQSSSSNQTPNLGISIGRKCSPKKKKALSSHKKTWKRKEKKSSLVAQWVRYLVLSLLWLKLGLWHRFDPWPENFCKPQVQPKKKERERENGEEKKKRERQGGNFDTNY